MTTGGNALKFYASLRLDVRRIGQVKKGDERLGNRTRVRAVKNKLAPPFKQVEFDIMWGTGISADGELIELGLERGILSKSGNWLSMGEVSLGNGREAARAKLKERTALWPPRCASCLQTEDELGTVGEDTPEA